MATLAAYSTFKRVWSDPASMAARGQFVAQMAIYNHRWHLYQNSVFDDVTTWQSYRARYGLYRYIRPIYNPVTRLVDFYAGIVYPGVLATDAKKLPDGTQLAIPLAPDIKPDLRDAIGQLWQWSNWQIGKDLMVLYGASLGDVPVEVVDEVDRGKVIFDILWPSWINELELDSTGNVKAYAIEYDAEDDEGKSYTYRKEVDGERIAEYKDKVLFQYDGRIDAERPNPYGFAPLVWVKHSDIGGNHGNPAVRNVGKIDELNEMASHAHDRAHAVLSSPVVASGKNSQSLTDAKMAERQPATQDQADPMGGRATLKVIRAEEGAAMAGVQLSEGEAIHYMAQLIVEIEEDHPELTMYKKLREMSQITGPAAEILVGDAGAYVQKARGAYDTQSIKLFQMAVAIAGWRVQTGAWGGRGRSLSRQQQAFTGFNLESYQAGDLDFEIQPRPIVPKAGLSPDERRVLMEQGDRGYSPRAKVIDALGGDSAKDMAAIEAEQAAQPVAMPQTVDELALALQRNQQSAQVAQGEQGQPLTNG